MIAKKLSLLFLFVFAMSTALSADINATTSDGKQIILKPDGTWHYKNEKPEATYEVDYGKPYFLAQDGYEKEVRVLFKYVEDVKKTVPAKKLPNLVISAVVDTKFKAKNQLSFVPVEVFLYVSEGKNMILVKWLGKNSFGAEGIETSFYKVDSKFEAVSPF